MYKAKKAQILIGNTPYKVKTKWLSLLERLNILIPLTHFEKKSLYELRVENMELRHTLEHVVREEIRKNLDD